MRLHIINVKGVPVLEAENHPPLPRYVHGPQISPPWLPRVKARPWKIHIRHARRRVQHIKYIAQLLRVFCLNSLFDTVVKELFQYLVLEALYHRRTPLCVVRSVTRGVALVNRGASSLPEQALSCPKTPILAGLGFVLHQKRV